MESASIVQDIASLPPEAQREVIDFIAFLKTRYPTAPDLSVTNRTELTDEPFVGMWRDREDMQDSTAWVRNMRRSEWEQHP
jgi:hypothetical protein